MPDTIPQATGFSEATTHAAELLLTLYEQKQQRAEEIDKAKSKLFEEPAKVAARTLLKEYAAVYGRPELPEIHDETLENINQEIMLAKQVFVKALKSSDAYVLLTDPQAFSQICADTVNATKASYEEKGIPFTVEHVFTAEDFQIRLSRQEQRAKALLVEKKQAFERVRTTLWESIQEAMQHAPESLDAAMAGILARNILPLIVDGKSDQSGELVYINLMDATKMMRMLIAESLAELPEDEKTPERIFNKIINNVVCTAAYLMHLVDDPAYLHFKRPNNPSTGMVR